MVDRVLTTIQTETFADIMKDIAQVFFASIFVASFVGRSFDIQMMTEGIILSLVFWSISLAIMVNLDK